MCKYLYNYYKTSANKFYKVVAE